MFNLEQHLASLNVEQLEAVKCTEGPLLILAGAGTGKTNVLTSRIAYIINQNLASPQNILAVTFTNKAAKEMHERVIKLIDAPGLNVGTFHSIASKILRSHIELLGSPLKRSFTIIDYDEQAKLIKNIAIAFSIDIKKYTPKIFHSIISRWKDSGLLPQKLLESNSLTDVYKLAKKIYFEYQNTLTNANLIDFGDLLLYNNELLINNPSLLEYYQEHFKYILIDEYQDTNVVQYSWVRMLATKHKNICCVGDDDQSIYGWRGAEVKNILRFEQDFKNPRVIKLERNYRSTSPILEAAGAIIKNNKNRHDKTLWTEQGDGQKIKIISCWNDREEARFVACEIEKLITNNKCIASQIAILVRAGFQTRIFEEVFNSNAIPYKIVGGFKFYERMEIRDLLAYIRLCLNPLDNLALERIINVPKRAIGNSTLKLIKDFASLNNIAALEAIKKLIELEEFKPKAREALSQFIQLIDSWAIRYTKDSAFEVTKSILYESGYLEILEREKTDESRARIENLSEMLKAIDEFNNIGDFVEHAALVMENDSLELTFGGAVNVMTKHAAKGLEFDIVFLPGWEEGVFPHQRALYEEGEKGLEEERRLAYVAITRAKKDLYITYAGSRRVFNEILNSLPSRFIAEIPEHICIKISSDKHLNYFGSKHNFSLAQASKAVKPLANLAKPPQISLPKDAITPGTKVRHVSFGDGVVIRLSDDNLEIVFSSGIKTIKRSYVDLI